MAVDLGAMRGVHLTATWRTAAFLLAIFAAGGCGSKPITDAVPVAALAQHTVEFEFDSLDERPVSSHVLRGKPTVMAFVASDDLASQAQVDFLATMAKHDGDKVNYVFVAVETPERRELVEGFRRFFESKFGVVLGAAMADKATLEGKGAFGDVRGLTVVVMDPTGRIAWLRTGIARSDEIRAALRRL